jgi:two-component system cell cycle response regulator
MAEEKRRAPRRRVLKDGKVITHKNCSVVDCCVRDLSETGARIRCQDQAAIPSEFRLLLPMDGIMRDARVVWRRGDDLGVQFTAEWKKAPPRKW